MLLTVANHITRVTVAVFTLGFSAGSVTIYDEQFDVINVLEYQMAGLPRNWQTGQSWCVTRVFTL